MSSRMKFQSATLLPPDTLGKKFGDIEIEVTEDGSVVIKGAKSILVETEDFSVDAERINLHARESYELNVDGDIYIGSSTHLIMQAPRIDHNPKKNRESGYLVIDQIKKLIRTFSNYYPSWRDIKRGYVDERIIEPKKEPAECSCGKCSASKS